MLDQLGKGTIVALLSAVLGYAVNGILGVLIALFIALVIALVLWTPLRGWLGLPPPKEVRSGSTFARLRGVGSAVLERNESTAGTFVDARDSSDLSTRDNVHNPELGAGVR